MQSNSDDEIDLAHYADLTYRSSLKESTNYLDNIVSSYPDIAEIIINQDFRSNIEDAFYYIVKNKYKKQNPHLSLSRVMSVSTEQTAILMVIFGNAMLAILTIEAILGSTVDNRWILTIGTGMQAFFLLLIIYDFFMASRKAQWIRDAFDKRAKEAGLPQHVIDNVVMALAIVRKEQENKKQRPRRRHHRHDWSPNDDGAMDEGGWHDDFGWGGDGGGDGGGGDGGGGDGGG